MWSLKLPFVFTFRLTYSQMFFIVEQLATAQKTPCALQWNARTPSHGAT